MTARSLGPRRVMERERASCSIWPHGRTQKEKENAEEKQCQYRTCAVCLNRPSISASPALTPPYSNYQQPTHTGEVTGLHVARPGTQRRIMR